MSVLKTKLHHYQFESGEDQAYKAMVQQIEADGVEGRGRQMSCLGNGKFDQNFDDKQTHFVIEDVRLDTTHLFENQWNETEPGNRRLFDWYEEAIFIPGSGMKSDRKIGHWLEITAEMSQARTNCFKCGYCDHQYGLLHEMPVPADGFCRNCLDSPYLEERNFYLLKLLPLVGSQDRRKLTEAEQAVLLPLYMARQITDSDSRANKAAARATRAQLLEKITELEKQLAEHKELVRVWNPGRITGADL